MGLLVTNFYPNTVAVPSSGERKIDKLPSAILAQIFQRLVIKDLGKVSLTCKSFYRAACLLSQNLLQNNWPQLYYQDLHPRRNWLPIYASRVIAEQNQALGKCTVSKMALPSPEEDVLASLEFQQFGYRQLGYKEHPAVRSPKGHDFKVVNLVKWKATKILYRFDQIYMGCGWLFTNHGRNLCGYNLQTSEKIFDSALPQGKHAVCPSADSLVFCQDNQVILLSDDKTYQRGAYLFDPKKQQFRELAPPSEEYQLSERTFRNYSSNDAGFPSNGTLSLLWHGRSSEGSKVVVATYHTCFEESTQKPFAVQDLPLSNDITHFLEGSHPQDCRCSAFFHEGIHLIKRSSGWKFFKDNKNIRLDQNDSIARLFLVPGKIVFYVTFVGTLGYYDCKEAKSHLFSHLLNKNYKDRLGDWMHMICPARTTGQDTLLLLPEDLSEIHVLNPQTMELKTQALVNPKKIAIRPLDNSYFDGERVYFMGKESIIMVDFSPPPKGPIPAKIRQADERLIVGVTRTIRQQIFTPANRSASNSAPARSSPLTNAPKLPQVQHPGQKSRWFFKALAVISLVGVCLLIAYTPRSFWKGLGSNISRLNLG